jgi:hypothetical protein
LEQVEGGSSVYSQRHSAFFQLSIQTNTMKITLLAITLACSNAFAPVSVSRTTSLSMGAGNMEPVDRTMNGIDDNLGYEAFDPTAGENPAVARNNQGGVWVQQVRFGFVHT